MIPGYVYRFWGVLCGVRSIDIGNGRKIQWVFGQAALNHLGNGEAVPVAFNDNDRGKVAS